MNNESNVSMKHLSHSIINAKSSFHRMQAAEQLMLHRERSKGLNDTHLRIRQKLTKNLNPSIKRLLNKSQNQRGLGGFLGIAHLEKLGSGKSRDDVNDDEASVTAEEETKSFLDAAAEYHKTGEGPSRRPTHDAVKLKRFRSLVRQSSFLDQVYQVTTSKLAPCLMFEKLLPTSFSVPSETTAAVVSRPDALIVGPLTTFEEETRRYLWISSDKREMLSGKGAFETVKEMIVHRLSLPHGAGSEGYPLAVWKSPDSIPCTATGEYTGNETLEADPVQYRKLYNNTVYLLWSEHDIRMAIEAMEGKLTGGSLQRYVKPKGKRAWVVRVVWQLGVSMPHAWILSNTTGLLDLHGGEACTTFSSIDNTMAEKALSIVKSATAAKSFSIPCEATATLALRMQKHYDLALSELAVDCLQDDEGMWYLLQVKAFDMSSPMLHVEKKAGHTSLEYVQTALLADPNTVLHLPHRPAVMSGKQHRRHTRKKGRNTYRSSSAPITDRSLATLEYSTVDADSVVDAELITDVVSELSERADGSPLPSPSRRHRPDGVPSLSFPAINARGAVSPISATHRSAELATLRLPDLVRDVKAEDEQSVASSASACTADLLMGYAPLRSFAGTTRGSRTLGKGYSKREAGAWTALKAKPKVAVLWECNGDYCADKGDPAVGGDTASVATSVVSGASRSGGAFRQVTWKSITADREDSGLGGTTALQGTSNSILATLTRDPNSAVRVCNACYKAYHAKDAARFARKREEQQRLIAQRSQQKLLQRKSSASRRAKGAGKVGSAGQTGESVPSNIKEDHAAAEDLSDGVDFFAELESPADHSIAPDRPGATATALAVPSPSDKDFCLLCLGPLHECSCWQADEI